MDSFDLIRKFHSTLPMVRKWIDDVLEDHKDQATPIINVGFLRLQQVFPSELLQKAKVVVVTGEVPFPPLSRMGLPELAQMENMSKDGITYKDTFFSATLNAARVFISMNWFTLSNGKGWELIISYWRTEPV